MGQAVAVPPTRPEIDAQLLTLLTQILIKVHAGKEWGETDAGVIQLTQRSAQMVQSLAHPIGDTKREGGVTWER